MLPKQVLHAASSAGQPATEEKNTKNGSSLDITADSKNTKQIKQLTTNWHKPILKVQLEEETVFQSQLPRAVKIPFRKCASESSAATFAKIPAIPKHVFL